LLALRGALLPALAGKPGANAPVCSALVKAFVVFE